MDEHAQFLAREEAARLVHSLDGTAAALKDFIGSPGVKAAPDAARKIALARTNAEQAKLWLADALADLGGEVGT